MNCQKLRDALVDVARGVAIGPGTAGAVRSHVEHCTACAARFAREQELSAALKELAAEGTSQVSADTERRLVEAFDRRASRQPTVAPTGELRRVLAASLAALAAGAGWFAWSGSFAPVGSGTSSGTTARRAADTYLARESVRAEETGRPADPGPRPDRTVPRRTSRRSPASAARSLMSEFQPVPGAAGLPELESGRIVRVELPMAALATYGVEMVPDPARADIEADLIIGQDGHPRAIRVVRSEPESRSRR